MSIKAESGPKNVASEDIKACVNKLLSFVEQEFHGSNKQAFKSLLGQVQLELEQTSGPVIFSQLFKDKSNVLKLANIAHEQTEQEEAKKSNLAWKWTYKFG